MCAYKNGVPVSCSCEAEESLEDVFDPDPNRQFLSR